MSKVKVTAPKRISSALAQTPLNSVIGRNETAVR